MSIVRWNPTLTALNRWPSFFDEEDLLPLNQTGSNLDLYETEDEVVVKANIAGVPADKLDITFEKGVLWIKATAEEEKQDSAKKHYSKASWNYSYRIAVPGDIDHQAEPDAEVDNGVLTVSFKKAEASKPKKLSVKAKQK